MLNSKQKTLFSCEEKKSTTSDNAFLKEASKVSAITQSHNGAKKYNTTGNSFVDQFAKLSEYRKIRSYSDIEKDASELWAIDSLKSVMFIFYLRIITRIVSFFDGTKTNTVQRGAGLRHESIMRMMWLHINHPNAFWSNIHLFISIGSWKDIITMLSYDLQYNGWDKRMLNWDQFGKLIIVGLENKNSVNLLKKYLPSIRSKSKCKTIESQADNLIAKWICSLLYGVKPNNVTSVKFYGHTYKLYRKLKSSGTAHQWQQLISQGKHDLVNFDTVHGRALALMVSSKYLENHNLTKKYEKWIDSKPVAKFTGYPHELFKDLNSTIKIKTVNKQFMSLVETAKKGAVDNTSLIVVRDTSDSMRSSALGCNMSCFDIGKALALFFSYMLPSGTFANSFIEFKDKATLHTWKGSTPVEKWANDRTNTIGNTNFQSVIDLFVRLKISGIDEKEFPSGILCISDYEFDPASLDKTNVEIVYEKLNNAGFSKEYVDNFKIVLWNLNNEYYQFRNNVKFETHGDVKNVFYFSGYDPSTIAFLTGLEGKNSSKTPTTSVELFEAAMDQEVLNMIEI